MLVWRTDVCSCTESTCNAIRSFLVCLKPPGPRYVRHCIGKTLSHRACKPKGKIDGRWKKARFMICLFQRGCRGAEGLSDLPTVSPDTHGRARSGRSPTAVSPLLWLLILLRHSQKYGTDIWSCWTGLSPLRWEANLDEAADFC